MPLQKFDNITFDYSVHTKRTLENVIYFHWPMDEKFDFKRQDPEKVIVELSETTEIALPSDEFPFPHAILQFLRVPWQYGVNGYMYYYITNQRRNDREERTLNCLYVSAFDPNTELWETVKNEQLKWARI